MIDLSQIPPLDDDGFRKWYVDNVKTSDDAAAVKAWRDELHGRPKGTRTPKNTPGDVDVVMLRETIRAKLDVCRRCKHFGDHVRGGALHCRVKGGKPNCHACRVSLLADSIHEGCPLDLWKPLDVHNSAGGLGDAVVGLYAVCGLADATGRVIRYHAHSAQWLRASHPGVVILNDTSRVGPDMNGGRIGYANQIRTAASRAQAYADNLARGLALPKFAPTRPRTIASRASTGVSPIVIAPMCCYSSRDWPRERYRRLTDELQAQGRIVQVIGSAKQTQPIWETWRESGAEMLLGQPPANVVDLILSAAMVIGNDSGIAHLAGLYGVPAISIHAGCLPHELLFDMAPSVVSVTPPGERPRSDHNPAALSLVSVDAVLACLTGVAS